MYIYTYIYKYNRHSIWWYKHLRRHHHGKYDNNGKEWYVAIAKAPRTYTICFFLSYSYLKTFEGILCFSFYRKLYQLFACFIQFSRIQRKPIEGCPCFLVKYISIQRFQLSNKKCDNRPMTSLPAHQQQKTFQFGSMILSGNAFPDLDVESLKVRSQQRYNT